jgi:phosphoadenosine phosphosulfate reductase
MSEGLLHTDFSGFSPQERLEKLFSVHEKVLLTSSFGITSAYLLHLVNQVKPGHPVYFLDTTYHFPETLAYKQLLTSLMNLNVIDLKGEAARNLFTKEDRTWLKDPDLCCSINKVEPLSHVKEKHEVWISGLMRGQTEHRSKLSFLEDRGGILKFYPILDISEEEVHAYLEANGLPSHPLKTKGFHSVGCTHCTSEGKSREGRWIDKSKTECGLHF